MKDIANSHKVFSTEKEKLQTATFSHLHSIKQSLSFYFEHDSDMEAEPGQKQANPPQKTEPSKPFESSEKPQPKGYAPISNDKEAKELYNELIEVIHTIKDQIHQNQKINVNGLLPLLPKFVTKILEDNSLLTMALNPERLTDWFTSHSINTTILAVKISNGMNYTKKQMYALALSTLLHDIGMLKIDPAILNNTGELTAHQKNILKNHPNYGVNLVSHLSSSYPFLIKTIYEEHENFDGSGYPKGIKGEQISPFARIISLVDKFESLVHKRDYRPAFQPPLAIQKIISENTEGFDPKVLKAFINEISMYPVGSYVMLNTGQAAQVLSINKNRPVRPLVKILTNNEGKKLTKPEQLNLDKEPLIHITKTINFSE